MTIYTFNARDNVFWEVVKNRFNMSGGDVYKEINMQHKMLVKRLEVAGIDYSDLRSTLTPQKNKKEVCFIFDSNKISNSFYGGVVLKHFIEPFSKINKAAVFFGDIISAHSKRAQLNIKNALVNHAVLYNDLDFSHSTQYFVVYVNNLTDAILGGVLHEVESLNYFVGYADLSYGNYLKNVISFSIPQQFVIHKGKVLLVSIDGESEGFNHTIFNFEATNLKIINIDEYLYNSFLSYKIKRDYFEMDNLDQVFSVNSVYQDGIQIDGFKVFIDENKFKYLLDNKSGSLKKGNLSGVSRQELERQIVNNINLNYLFNLEFNDYGVLKFNTDIECLDRSKQEFFRLIASFEIVISEKLIRLITLY